jgi:hypothetical protein
MNELHRDRPFSDAGSHAFHRTVAHVAHGKNAGNVGFEQGRDRLERPSFRALAITASGRARSG